MKNFISQIIDLLPVLEALSFIATISIAIFAYIGLKQLGIAKNTLKMQSLRNSRKISADYIYKYLDGFVNQQKFKDLESEDLSLLRSFVFNETKEDGVDYGEIRKINEKLKLNTRKQKDDYIKKVISAAKVNTEVLNEFEAFCAVVSSAVPDEEILYKAIGHHFVNKIERHNLEHIIPFLAKEQGIYVNLSEIYKLWSVRYKLKNLEKLETENIEITKRISQLKKKIDTIKHRTIKPIGTADE